MVQHYLWLDTRDPTPASTAAGSHARVRGVGPSRPWLHEMPITVLRINPTYFARVSADVRKSSRYRSIVAVCPNTNRDMTRKSGL